jgi:hypothetical protein
VQDKTCEKEKGAESLFLQIVKKDRGNQKAACGQVLKPEWKKNRRIHLRPLIFIFPAAAIL